MSEENKAIVQRVNTAFAQNDLEDVLSFCTEDIAWTMVGDQTLRGKQTIRDWMASVSLGPPKFTVDTLVAEGNHVMAMGHMTMTENGEKVHYDFCDAWRFRDGKLAELKAFVIKVQA